MFQLRKDLGQPKVAQGRMGASASWHKWVLLRWGKKRMA